MIGGPHVMAALGGHSTNREAMPNTSRAGPAAGRPESAPVVPTAEAHAAHVVVCIPTYRRPAQLAALLAALGRQVGAPPFAIVVGNNEPRPLSSHRELAADDLPPFIVIDVTRRGVSAVRNAMIAHVLERMDAAWIACIDDDQVPADDWLAELMAAGDRERADLVGGPVSRTVTESTYWSTSAADTSYLPSEAGLVDSLNEAGNLLLSTTFLRTLRRPPFSEDFGRTGGEDYEFFLCARRVGARLAWAPAARVDEALRGGHLTFRGYLWRFYSIAAYQARADRAYFGPWSTICRTAVEAGKTPLVLMRSVFRERSAARAIAIVLRSCAIAAGRIAGLLGARAERYGGDA